MELCCLLADTDDEGEEQDRHEDANTDKDEEGREKKGREEEETGQEEAEEEEDDRGGEFRAISEVSCDKSRRVLSKPVVSDVLLLSSREKDDALSAM